MSLTDRIKWVPRGKTIIRWTLEEIDKHNKVNFANGTEIEIYAKSDPNEYSLETAEVAASMLYPLGTRVVVDYAIFTLGMYKDLQQTKTSRYLFEEGNHRYYWCYDGSSKQNESEIFGTLIPVPAGAYYLPIKGLTHVPVDHLCFTPAPSLVFIDPPQGDGWQAQGGLILQQVDDRDLMPFRARICYSGNADFKPGEVIWSMPGFTIPIKLPRQVIFPPVPGDLPISVVDRMLQLEYTTAPYILGKDERGSVRLL